MKPKLLRLHPQDNVVIATAAIRAGTTLRLDRIKLQVISNVPMAGKIATRPIAEGEKIIKFGHPIGHATRNIEPGEWVHTHNLASDYLPTPKRASAKAAREQAEVAVSAFPEEDLDTGSPEAEVTEGLELSADLVLSEETTASPPAAFQETDTTPTPDNSVPAPPAEESTAVPGEISSEGTGESEATSERGGASPG